MEITTCPECAAEVVSAGMALWADSDEPTDIFECVDHCGWVGIAAEYWSMASAALVPSAA
jgi:hypothetical protein